MPNETETPEWLAPLGMYQIDRVVSRPVRVPVDATGHILAGFEQATDTAPGMQIIAYHAAGFDGDGTPVLRHTVRGNGFSDTIHAYDAMDRAIRGAGGKWLHR